MNLEIQEAVEQDIKRYLELKDQMDSLDVKMETIKINIQGYMDQSGTEQLVATGYGKFVREGKRSWAYTPDVVQEEEALKKKKKEQQQLGTATSTEDKYIKFYPYKA